MGALLLVEFLPSGLPAGEEFLRGSLELPRGSRHLLSDAQLWIHGIDLPTLLCSAEETRNLERHTTRQRKVPAIYILSGHGRHSLHASSRRLRRVPQGPMERNVVHA